MDKLWLDSDISPFPILFTGPRLGFRVRVLALLYAAGFGKVVSLLGYKQQDFGIQGGLCSTVGHELDSCSQSVG